MKGTDNSMISSPERRISCSELGKKKNSLITGNNILDKFANQTVNIAGYPAEAIKISIVCPGQYFGEEDVLNDRNYTTTVRCLSNEAYLYCVKAEEFTHRMSRDDKTWKMLHKLNLDKDDFTIGKIQHTIHCKDARENQRMRETTIDKSQGQPERAPSNDEARKPLRLKTISMNIKNLPSSNASCYQNNFMQTQQAQNEDLMSNMIPSFFNVSPGLTQMLSPQVFQQGATTQWTPKTSL